MLKSLWSWLKILEKQVLYKVTFIKQLLFATQSENKNLTCFLHLEGPVGIKVYNLLNSSFRLPEVFHL